ncbi:MAG TPA: methyltransferase domain-containing protein [Solirubrobacteraceae bacterium]|nr:methyltransferase domain-containing protein [Solirubrobacteraceae bacterium]
MKICLRCDQRFEAEDWTCPACGHEPERKGGLLLFAPELDSKVDDFDARWFPALAAREAASFWFRGRNQLIVWALGRHFPSARNLLEVGCGTGFVVAGIAQAVAPLTLAAGDAQSSGLAFARDRVPRARLYQLDARSLPFECEFDVVGAFDVIEHLDEDERVLSQMWRAVRPGGGVLITVPQHRWLWSAEDEAGGHKRRYSRRELVQKVERAGFSVERVTSFVSVLLPLMAASRLRGRVGMRHDPDSNLELSLPRWLDRLLETAMTAERALVRAGVSLPAGGSLLLVARRT